MKKKSLILTMIGSMVVLSFLGCKKDAPESQQPATNSTVGTGSSGTTTKGNATLIPAYYDSTIFHIQFVEFSPTSEAQLIAHNGQMNFIFQSDPGLPNNQPFISVIDAIPHDG